MSRLYFLVGSYFYFFLSGFGLAKNELGYWKSVCQEARKPQISHS